MSLGTSGSNARSLWIRQDLARIEDMKEQEPPALPAYEAGFRVPFHDFDPVRIVWHGNYCKGVPVETKHQRVVEFELRLAGGGTLCAGGRTEQAACKLPGTELMLRIPAELSELLGQSHSTP
jgi:acyl-CoA thioesterase FadM